jgi:hypothetical protein
MGVTRVTVTLGEALAARTRQESGGNVSQPSLAFGGSTLGYPGHLCEAGRGRSTGD